MSGVCWWELHRQGSVWPAGHTRDRHEIDAVLVEGHHNVQGHSRGVRQTAPSFCMSEGSSLTWKFSLILSGVVLLGMTTNPRWMSKRNTIWACVLLYFFPSKVRSSSFNKGGEDTFTLEEEGREENTCHLLMKDKNPLVTSWYSHSLVTARALKSRLVNFSECNKLWNEEVL